jgi:hypothetical protein
MYNRSDYLMQTTDFMVIDKVIMPQVMAFICDKLADYDTTEVEWIKLLPLYAKEILHGCCTYPMHDDSLAHGIKSGYRLRASVNVEAPPPYYYEHWARIPSNSHRQGWYSGAKMFRFEDLEACATHTLAHECFHFLSHSKQVKLKNTEANANWWADQWLAEFSA